MTEQILSIAPESNVSQKKGKEIHLIA